MFPISDSVKAARFPFFNILIIGITIFVFFQQLVSPDQLIQEFALIPANVNFSKVVTLLPFITAIFLHGGFLHIISNLWFLWVFGDNVEGYLGPFLFLLLYFAAGIVGNLIQYVLMPTSTIPMLGASGAIAGVLGAYYVLFPNSKVKTLIPFFGFFTIVDISATFMLGYWFVLQLFSGVGTLSAASQQGGIAFWAHVSGFLTGIFFAKIFFRRDKGYVEVKVAQH